MVDYIAWLLNVELTLLGQILLSYDVLYKRDLFKYFCMYAHEGFGGISFFPWKWFCGFVADVILTSENELRSNFFILFFYFLEEFV